MCCRGSQSEEIGPAHRDPKMARGGGKNQYSAGRYTRPDFVTTVAAAFTTGEEEEMQDKKAEAAALTRQRSSPDHARPATQEKVAGAW